MVEMILLYLCDAYSRIHARKKNDCMHLFCAHNFCLLLFPPIFFFFFFLLLISRSFSNTRLILLCYSFIPSSVYVCNMYDYFVRFFFCNISIWFFVRFTIVVVVAVAELWIFKTISIYVSSQQWLKAFKYCGCTISFLCGPYEINTNIQ